MRAIDQHFEPMDRTMLVYKTGILGSAPLDAFRRVADEYDAAFVSSDEIRRDLLAGDIPNLRVPKAGDDVMRRIRGIGRDRVRSALEDGDDVVLDMFVNSPRTRQELARIAEDTGALTVAVLAEVPDDVALERVRQWTEEDAFVIPVAEWDVTPEFAARGMIRSFTPPAPDEAIDYVLRLDGALATPDLLDQFDAQLARHGLTEA